MKRPDGLSRDPFQDQHPVRDRPDMEVDHKDNADGTVYYRDKVEDKIFYLGQHGRRVDA